MYIQAPELKDRDIDNPSVMQDFARHEMGLRRLTEKNLIRILNAGEYLRIGIHIHVVDIPAFKAFYAELFESIPATGNGARIVYSTRNGTGKINGVPFRLNRSGRSRRSRNRQVVEYLLKHPGQYITKKKLWVVAGEKGKYDDSDPDSRVELNNIITALREALKNISPEHLRLKETIILDAEVTLTD